jgi:hypothetical protein
LNHKLNIYGRFCKGFATYIPVFQVKGDIPEEQRFGFKYTVVIHQNIGIWKKSGHIRNSRRGAQAINPKIVGACLARVLQSVLPASLPRGVLAMTLMTSNST